MLPVRCSRSGLARGAGAVGEGHRAEGPAGLDVGLDRDAGRRQPADEGEPGPDVVVHVLPGDEAGALVDLRDRRAERRGGGEVAGRHVEHHDVLRGVDGLVGVTGLAGDAQRPVGHREVVGAGLTTCQRGSRPLPSKPSVQVTVAAAGAAAAVPPPPGGSGRRQGEQQGDGEGGPPTGSARLGAGAVRLTMPASSCGVTGSQPRSCDCSHTVLALTLDSSRGNVSVHRIRTERLTRPSGRGHTADLPGDC